MNRVLVVLMLGTVLPNISAAQQTGGRVAYDYCDNTYMWGDDVNVYECHVYAFDRGGDHAWVGPGFDPALSPDGTRVAYVIGEASSGPFNPVDIVVMDLRDRSVRNLTADDPAPASAPAWSRDGLRIAFQSSRTGTLELYVIKADGTGLDQLTDGAGFQGYPTWSPDDRIAFTCTGDAGRRNLCSISADGTGFRRLTNADGDDGEPAFSPDGTRIAFATNRFGAPKTLAILNADGTVTNLGGRTGNAPAWSPDGRQLAFFLPADDGGYACNAFGPCPLPYASIYAMDVATATVSGLSGGANPTWADTPAGGFPPHAAFMVTCTLLTCTFDASPSSDDEGAIVSYGWRFDDGTVQTGISVFHTYLRSGTYTEELTVVDAGGMRHTSTRTFDVTESAPVASFTRACSGPTCHFDAFGSFDSDGRIVAYNWNFGDGGMVTTSDPVVTHWYALGTYTATLTVSDNAGAISGPTSAQIIVVNTPPVANVQFFCDMFVPVCVFDGSASDPDGNVVSWAWNFGDGTQGSGHHLTHTYAEAGIYTVTLTVTDSYGAISMRAMNVTVNKVALHVGDLDAAKAVQKKYWTASVSVTIHDAAHRPAVNARVAGVWSIAESGVCYTDSSGVCIVAAIVPNSAASVTFTVHDVSLGSAIYDAARNHDVEGETNGTSITLTRK